MDGIAIIFCCYVRATTKLLWTRAILLRTSAWQVVPCQSQRKEKVMSRAARSSEEEENSFQLVFPLRGENNSVTKLTGSQEAQEANRV